MHVGRGGRRQTSACLAQQICGLKPREDNSKPGEHSIRESSDRRTGVSTPVRDKCPNGKSNQRHDGRTQHARPAGNTHANEIRNQSRQEKARIAAVPSNSWTQQGQTRASRERRRMQRRRDTARWFRCAWRSDDAPNRLWLWIRCQPDDSWIGGPLLCWTINDKRVQPPVFNLEIHIH
jgi:hypothetical protein